MEEIGTTGLDIVKSLLHAMSEAGEVVVRRQLKRRQVLQFFAMPLGTEASASAHHRAREVMKLAMRFA